MLNPIMLLVSTSAILSLSAFSSPLVRNWTNDHRMCKSFATDIYAETDNNMDLASVIGYPADFDAFIQSNYINPNTVGNNVSGLIHSAPFISVKANYSMYFEYCQPKSGATKGVFQTHHGLVASAAYWNLPLRDRAMSFANAAADAGWATLSYDRLGTGQSAHPDGTNVVQTGYEIAQSIAISKGLREGTLSEHVPSHEHIVGIGHSYGSVLLLGVTALEPSAFDQVVLTGFSPSPTNGPLGLAGFMPSIASLAYPDRFGSLPNDYVVTASIANDQIGFFHFPNYTHAALQLFTDIKGEYTLGQANSIGYPFSLSREEFSNPAFLITGDRDAPFCAGNCSANSADFGATQLDNGRKLFPSVISQDFETHVIPDTGHGINFHNTAALAYERILEFVAAHSK